MADPVVLDFDGTEAADAMPTRLRAPKMPETVDLPDAVVVVRPEEATPGKVIAKTRKFWPLTLRIALSQEQEERLREALAARAFAAPAI
jgi:uncharacterized membrane protein